MKKNLIIIALLLIMVFQLSCTGGFINKTIGAGIELLSNGVSYPEKKEQIEIQFPITEIKLQKFKWYEIFKKYEDQIVRSEAYDISISFDKDKVFMLIVVKPTYVKGLSFPHSPVAVEIGFPFNKNTRYYEYDSEGNPFEVQLIQTEQYYIIRIQKLPVIIEI